MRGAGATSGIADAPRPAAPGPAPARVFLGLAGCFGLFFALVTPPHDPPDESRHHGRAWLVSTGWLGVVGEAPGHAASVPWDIAHLHPHGHHYVFEQERVMRLAGPVRSVPPHAPSEIWTRLRGHLDPTRFQPVRILTPYEPIVYAPYLPGLWLARALGVSAAAGLVLARLSGLAFWLAGVWMTLQVAPSQRWLLAATALVPMSVFQAASVSADPPTQLAVFWLFAEWLRAARDGGRARLLLPSLALGLVKAGYAPLTLACVALPGPPRRRLGIAAAALGAAALPTLAWAAVLQSAREPAMVPGADALAQLHFVLAHPLAFLGAAAGTTRALAGVWLEGLVGLLGHLDVTIPAGATALALAALAASATLDRGGLPRDARLLLPVAFGITSLALLFLAYAGWTPVGADKILGFQGRYLLPMLPFALVAVPGVRRRAERQLEVFVAGSLALVLGVSALAMLRAYYAL